MLVMMLYYCVCTLVVFTSGYPGERAALLTDGCGRCVGAEQMVGSSLLFLHDRHGAVGVWMIDFGKTEAHDDLELEHTTFTEDNIEKFEDGYLLGLENLIDVLGSLQIPN